MRAWSRSGTDTGTPSEEAPGRGGGVRGMEVPESRGTGGGCLRGPGKVAWLLQVWEGRMQGFREAGREGVHRPALAGVVKGHYPDSHSQWGLLGAPCGRQEHRAQRLPCFCAGFDL